ncbi:MAG: hypothetical protein D6767_10570 [Candidatus Hydrogenedentota bacterium]|nr:MAG: hypothetical protein D6767_10570 [Candidatus Hydrogenedentota bacterium]
MSVRYFLISLLLPLSLVLPKEKIYLLDGGYEFREQEKAQWMMLSRAYPKKFFLYKSKKKWLKALRYATKKDKFFVWNFPDFPDRKKLLQDDVKKINPKITFLFTKEALANLIKKWKLKLPTNVQEHPLKLKSHELRREVKTKIPKKYFLNCSPYHRSIKLKTKLYKDKQKWYWKIIRKNYKQAFTAVCFYSKKQTKHWLLVYEIPPLWKAKYKVKKSQWKNWILLSVQSEPVFFPFQLAVELPHTTNIYVKNGTAITYKYFAIAKTKNTSPAKAITEFLMRQSEYEKGAKPVILFYNEKLTFIPKTSFWLEVWKWILMNWQASILFVVNLFLLLTFLVFYHKQQRKKALAKWKQENITLRMIPPSRKVITKKHNPFGLYLPALPSLDIKAEKDTLTIHWRKGKQVFSHSEKRKEIMLNQKWFLKVEAYPYENSVEYVIKLIPQKLD